MRRNFRKEVEANHAETEGRIVRTLKCFSSVFAFTLPRIRKGNSFSLFAFHEGNLSRALTTVSRSHYNRRLRRRRTRKLRWVNYFLLLCSFFFEEECPQFKTPNKIGPIVSSTVVTMMLDFISQFNPLFLKVYLDTFKLSQQ